MRLRPAALAVALGSAALGAALAAWQGGGAANGPAEPAALAPAAGGPAAPETTRGREKGNDFIGDAGGEGPAPGARRGAIPVARDGAAQPLEGPAGGAAEASGEAFLGAPDAPVLRVLREAEVERVEPGKGGRSLGFVVWLQGGQKAYFKPEQRFSGARWYAEVAAYHLDRMLGLGRVPPVVARELPWKLLRAAARRHPRGEEIVVHSGGRVYGALIAWVEGGLPRLRLPAGWEQWLRVGRAPFLSPFVRPRDWLRAVQAFRQSGRIEGPLGGERWPEVRPDRPERPAELSDMILFDYLVRNVDRWSADFSNVRTRGPGGPLVFLDQAAGFAGGRPSSGHLDAQLRAVQRVRAATVRAIEAFDLAAYRARLRREPIQPVLDAPRLEGLRVRREALLRHVRELRERFGARRVHFEVGS